MNSCAHHVLRCIATALLGAAAVVAPVSAVLRWTANTQAQPPKDQRPPSRDEQNGRGKGRGLLAELSTFKTDVPAHPFDIVLVDPTSTSMTASVVAYADGEGYIEFGATPDNRTRSTPRQKVVRGVPALFKMEGLTPGEEYTYRWRSRSTLTEAPPAAAAKQEFVASEPYSFRTPRPVGGAGFTFTIQADSHLDPNVTAAVYLQTLANALADKPDFHIDLGDTFMTDKRGRDYKEALPQYVAQRYYFGQLCHSAPLFMVLGNHDGEVGYANDGPDTMARWSFAQRTKYFPQPEITDAAEGRTMYSGRTSFAKGQGANYYEFSWGDAQFIVLDPFWFTTARPRGGAGGSGAGRDKKGADTAGTDENWDRTLGEDQYRWLTSSLEKSTAKYRFVFIHHLVGGLGKANRGGVESSVFFEWGGENADGSAGFAEHRPGWAMPIHDLLVKHKVSAVFHGHDHLYVRGERDGIVYQCVPQPGNAMGATRSAAEYGYKSGTILGSPGYLRVRVGPEQVKVEFIRSADANAGEGQRGERSGAEVNKAVMHTYSIAPARGK